MKKGTAMLLALFFLMAIFMLGSTLLFSSRSRRMERYNYTQHLQLFYIAEAGVEHAFHLLKEHSYAKRFYLPAGGSALGEAFSTGRYAVEFNDSGANQVLIISRGVLGEKALTLKAEALFKTWTENRVRYEKWELTYIQE
ncbi:MAG: hypothetical protein PHW04_06765 [Candidatus Wallbacteria bacterium]|nr:hypothetical protein [Candidatus Wallbacteria bacterium]